MAYRISGLPIATFAPYLALDAAGLRAAGMAVRTADAPHAYPCRVTLEDAAPGEELLLVTHWHQPPPTPYAAAGPIFVRRAALATCVVHDRVPEQQSRRLLSVRAYDAQHCIVESDVLPGTALEQAIERSFARADVAYLHIHNARHGCYACRVDRD